jgi:peroxiredoxin
MAQRALRLAVGDEAPDFALRTAEGQEIHLGAVLSSRAALVVFIRGTW